MPAVHRVEPRGYALLCLLTTAAPPWLLGSRYGMHAVRVTRGRVAAALVRTPRSILHLRLCLETPCGLRSVCFFELESGVRAGGEGLR